MRNSLRMKLIAPFIAGTACLTMFLAWYTYKSAHDAVEDAVIVIAGEKAHHVASSIDLLFKYASSAIENMVMDSHLTALFSATSNRDEEVRRTTRWLEAIALSNEYYRDILIVDTNGLCIASSNPGHIGTTYSQNSYIHDALSGLTGFGDLSIGQVSKKFSATFAMPIDIGNGVVGALVLISDFPQIVHYAPVANDSDVVLTSLLTPEGLFAIHPDNTLTGKKETNLSVLYATLSTAGDKGRPVRYTLQNTDYIGYAQVEPHTGWVVIGSGPVSAAFAPADRIGLIVLAISLIFLAGITLIVMRQANSILDSLLALIGYAKDVSEGNIEKTLPPTRRTDELGTLHTSLQRLVGSLRTMLQKSEEANRMKNEFLANMSHEIRTPLNAIQGMVHLSLREGGHSDRHLAQLDKIRKAAKSLLAIISDILDLTKAEAGMIHMENAPFNLRDTIGTTIDLYRESAQAKGLSLSFDYDTHTAEFFFGDSLRIEQIVSNVLSNAIKFTHEGSISIRCWHDTQAQTDTETTVFVSVTDTGIGIPDHLLPVLFRPFTQADASVTRRFGGTGLGLAISKKLVDLMGGSIVVESALDKGTSLCFSMRLKPDTSVPVHAAHDAAADLSVDRLGIAGKTILIVEDNELNQMILNELIAPSGAKIMTAANGREAVETVAKNAIDLVLMDIQMPVMDGFEATRIIRLTEKGRTLPIIAVTANAMAEDKHKGLDSGMNAYLTKPIDPAALMRTLHAWLGEKKSSTGPKPTVQKRQKEKETASSEA